MSNLKWHLLNHSVEDMSWLGNLTYASDEQFASNHKQYKYCYGWSPKRTESVEKETITQFGEKTNREEVFYLLDISIKK